jgi:hypothetical protein
MGWGYVSELRPPTDLLFILQAIDAYLWQSYHQSHLVAKPEEPGERDYEFGVRSFFVHTWKWFLCRKILRQGADSFTSCPKEGVLRIFIVRKNPSTRPGLKPRTLGLMASTITITPPRLLLILAQINIPFNPVIGGGMLSYESSLPAPYERAPLMLAVLCYKFNISLLLSFPKFSYSGSLRW